MLLVFLSVFCRYQCHCLRHRFLRQSLSLLWFSFSVHVAQTVLIIIPKCASLTHLMAVLCTKFVISTSLRPTRLELDAFNVISTHQSSGQCITASRASRKNMQKLRKSQEILLMFWLLDCSSVVKCRTVRSCDKPQPAWRAVRNLKFCPQKCRDSQHLMRLLENSWCPPGNYFPPLTLTP